MSDLIGDARRGMARGFTQADREARLAATEARHAARRAAMDAAGGAVVVRRLVRDILTDRPPADEVLRRLGYTDTEIAEGVEAIEGSRNQKRQQLAAQHTAGLHQPVTGCPSCGDA